MNTSTAVDRSPTLSELVPGTKVFIVNLLSRRDLNGQVGRIETILDNGRVKVRTNSRESSTADQPIYISIKPENARIYKTVFQQQEEEKESQSPSSRNRSLSDTMCLLSEEVISFVLNTLSGSDSALYKTIDDKATFFSIRRVMAPKLLVQYLNSTYASLILKNNDYIVEAFRKMKSFRHHSEICLLNIILHVAMNLLQASMSFRGIDISSYDSFMKTMNEEYQKAGFACYIYLQESLSHICHGESIDCCDPKKPLFTIASDGNDHASFRSYAF